MELTATNKEWWEKKVRIWLPDDSVTWESLSWFERHWTIPRLRKRVEMEGGIK